LALRAARRRRAQRIGDQIGQLVLVIMKFCDIGRVLSNQFDGQRKRAGRIHVIVEINFAVHRTGFQHLGLQANSNGNHLFLFHLFLSFAFILYDESFLRSWSYRCDSPWAARSQSLATRGARRRLAGQAPGDRTAPMAVFPGSAGSEYFRYA
jgi:hypothetical protein